MSLGKPSAPSLPRLGIVAALRWEVQPLLRKRFHVRRLYDNVYSLELGQDLVVLSIGGISAQNSFRAARELAEKFQVQGLLTLGFAGGLAESLLPGDVVMADRVVDLATGEQFPCRGDLLPVRVAQRGVLLSANRVIGSAAEKRRLGKDWGAVAVDMESAGVARAAALTGVPFGAIKSITDISGQSISIDFQGCQSEHGVLSAFRMVQKGIQSWQAIRDLWALGLGARLAARNLAAALILA
ncbi:MAG: hypothetical protein A3G20_01435 [Acidobacteria bacterium RIFCSPLOWO2_12_FULL_59_11]|nr:MAG: hypothetical protein A3G20_01435 [Acidobacteria bacterium RIFCSPLOWO2_12_FULL_59_11]